ncbi:MAG TPA: hypothetical protein VIL77_13745 [Gaiellaceae bacterium]
MSTRKQRRRRAKDFRHDMRVFEVDEEGNEVPLAELRTPDERKPKPAKQQQQRKSRSGKPMREPPQPSWRRAVRRGGTMGGLMLVAFLFVLKNGPLPQRIGIGLFYGLAFIPLTYWIDRTAYRTYQRRLAKQAEKKA